MKTIKGSLIVDQIKPKQIALHWQAGGNRCPPVNGQELFPRSQAFRSPPHTLLQKYTETKRKAGSDFMHRGMDNRLLESSFRNNPASLCPRPIYKYRNKEKKKLQQYV